MIMIEETRFTTSIVITFEGFSFNSLNNSCYFQRNKSRDIIFFHVICTENLNYVMHEHPIQVMKGRYALVLEFFALEILVFFVKNKLFDIIFRLVCFDGFEYPLVNLLSLKIHTLSHVLLDFV